MAIGRPWTDWDEPRSGRPNRRHGPAQRAKLSSENNGTTSLGENRGWVWPTSPTFAGH